MNENTNLCACLVFLHYSHVHSLIWTITGQIMFLKMSPNHCVNLY